MTCRSPIPQGLIKEHQHTRDAAGLFDVSHMGQAFTGRSRQPRQPRALEALVPGEVPALGPAASAIRSFTTDDGGILDDLMITRLGRHRRKMAG